MFRQPAALTRKCRQRPWEGHAHEQFPITTLNTRERETEREKNGPSNPSLVVRLGKSPSLIHTKSLPLAPKFNLSSWFAGKPTGGRMWGRSCFKHATCTNPAAAWQCRLGVMLPGTEYANGRWGPTACISSVQTPTNGHRLVALMGPTFLFFALLLRGHRHSNMAR